MQAPGGPRFKEFVIRTAPTSQKISVGRFILSETTAEPAEFSSWPKPVRMVRQETVISENNLVPVPVDKERFKAFAADDKGKERLRQMPWHLEGASKDLNFQAAMAKSSVPQFLGKDKGGLEEAQTAHYFLFVQEGNEFKVYPSGDWWNFKPKIKYQILSSEEAEEKMKVIIGKEGKIDRWEMKKKKKPDEDSKEEGDDKRGDDKFNPFGQSKSSDEEDEGDDKKKKKKQKMFKIKDERDFDFQEKFDDDEGMDDAEDAVVAEKESKRKVNKEEKEQTKEWKKLLHDLEGESVAGEDDEESESEEETEEKDKLPKPVVPLPKPVKKELVEGVSLKKEQEEAIQTKAAPVPPVTGKRKAEPTTTTTTTTTQPAAKKIKTEGAGAKNLEQAVKQLLQRKGQMTIAELIKRFKTQVQGEEKKAEFMASVKNIANIKELPPGSGKKYLVLKDQYKTATPARGK